VIPNRECALALDGAQQIVVEKQTVDVFQAPNLSRVIERLEADRFVVYGVVTEICVLFAARGLLKAGKQVTVVTDAVETLKAEDSARALSEICALGGTLATVSQILENLPVCLAVPCSDRGLPHGAPEATTPTRRSTETVLPFPRM
jgi:nicotinamidase-related amidase